MGEQGHENPDTDALARADRMFAAVHAYEGRLKRKVPLDELGKLVAEAEGRDEPYDGSVVRRWLRGLSQPRTVAVWRALGSVLGVRPAWLAFGDGEMTEAPPPPSPANRVLSSEEAKAELRAKMARERKKRA